MPLLILLFIVIPLAELYVIIQIGGAIGLLPTVAILFADSVIGAMLLRSQGRTAWIRFNAALAEGKMPGREVFDGVVIIFGGALLLTPGFITDIVGLLFLLPPSRAAIRRTAMQTVKSRIAMGPRVAMWGAGRAQERYRQRDGAEAPAADQGPFDAGQPFGGNSPFGGGDPFGGATSGPQPAAGHRPGDIEGTATEVGGETELPPPHNPATPGERPREHPDERPEEEER